MVLDEAKAMDLAAAIVDLATDEGDDLALVQALAMLDDLTARPLSPTNAARAEYYRANAWSGRRLIQPQGWPWISEAIDNELLALRRALNHPGFSGLLRVRQAQIHTNHGNLLNHIGRFVEAVEAWDRAIALVPKMAMAHGNRGIGLAWYAGQLYDPGHGALLAAAARRAFDAALGPDALLESEGLDGALQAFGEYAVSIDRQIDVQAVEDSVANRQFSLGRSRKERDYRRWCLDERRLIGILKPAPATDIVDEDDGIVGRSAHHVSQKGFEAEPLFDRQSAQARIGVGADDLKIMRRGIRGVRHSLRFDREVLPLGRHPNVLRSAGEWLGHKHQPCRRTPSGCPCQVTGFTRAR